MHINFISGLIYWIGTKDPLPAILKTSLALYLFWSDESYVNIQSTHIGIFTKLNSCINKPAHSENEILKMEYKNSWNRCIEKCYWRILWKFEFFHKQPMEECYQIFEDKLMLCMEKHS